VLRYNAAGPDRRKMILEKSIYRSMKLRDFSAAVAP